MESEPDPARPRFLDLGVLAIEINGAEQRIGGRQLATILGVLLVDADRHVSIDRLLDALWPDGSGSTSTLDSHLYRLRKLIEPSRSRGAAPTVLLEGAELSQSVIDGLAAAAATYTGLIVQTSLNPFNSDHVSFIENGMPAVLTIEGADGANDEIHTARDTLDHINFDLSLEILRMNTAFVAENLGRVSNDAVAHGGL